VRECSLLVNTRGRLGGDAQRHYELEGEVSRRPRNALPSLVVLARAAWESPLVQLLAEEIVKYDPGQEAVLDRLPIAVLRVWFARPDADAPGWDRAKGDSVVTILGQRARTRGPAPPAADEHTSGAGGGRETPARRSGAVATERTSGLSSSHAKGAARARGTRGAGVASIRARKAQTGRTS
jgi:hypothetical protein